MEENQKDCKFL